MLDRPADEASFAYIDIEWAEKKFFFNFMSCTSEISSHPLLWKMANGKTFFQAPKNLRLLHHKLLSTAFDVLKSHL